MAGRFVRLGLKVVTQDDGDFLDVILMEHTVTQLVEALRYKPEVRGFDSRWCHWNFSLT